jgi:acyl carrier protein
MTAPLHDAPDGLRRTLASVLGVRPEEINDESSPDTIASWDSLNHLNLVMAIEGEFGVSLSAEDAMEMRNVGLIRTILGQHGVDA